MANIQAGQVSYGLRLFAGLLALALVGCGKQGQQVVDNLPWQVATTAQGHTHVFNVDVGKTTLRELIERLHSFPETAVFMDADKHLLLEAYFGKQSLGFLRRGWLLNWRRIRPPWKNLPPNTLTGRRNLAAVGV